MTFVNLLRHHPHRAVLTSAFVLHATAAQANPTVEDVCYVASDDSDRLTLLDPRTGEEVDLGPILNTTGNAVTDIEALALDPDTGVLYAANAGQLGTLDRASAVFTALGPTFQVGFGALGFITFDDLDALAYDPSNDVLWACERRGNVDVLLQLDPTTGLYRDNAMGGDDYVALDVANTNDCDDLAIRSGTNELWGLFSDGANRDRLGRIDKTTFAVTAAPSAINATTAALDDVEGLAFAPDGTLYGTTGGDKELLVIDPATGIATLVGTLDNGDPEGLACLTTRSTCGDGKLADREQCDDGNATSNDGCSACVIDATPGYCSDGQDGSLTLSAATTLNTYHPGLDAAPAGSTTLKVGPSRGAATAIAPGDLLLVIQMQGAELDTGASLNPNEPFGDGPRLNDRKGHLATAAFTAGLYERVRATTPVTDGVVGIIGEGPTGGLVHSYLSKSTTSASLGVQTFQVVRIPEPASLRLESSLTAAAWDGTSGGIAAVSVQGTVTFAGGGLDVSQLGFRGGAANTSRDNVQNQAGFPGHPGEGIAGRPQKTFATSGRLFVDHGTSGYPSAPEGVGAPGTGGGPAIRTLDSGAGGGANGGFGGRGGSGSGQNTTRAGLGAAPLSGPQHLFPTRHRATLGGGGGGTSGDDALPGDGSSSAGQSGGGIVFLWADDFAGNGGYLRANGASGSTEAGEGGGGGGAGGTIYVSSRNRALGDAITLEAKGGNGTGMTLAEDGGGGGGGGGLIFLERTRATQLDVAGGAGGSSTSGGVYIGRAGSAGLARPTVPASIGATCTFSFAPVALDDKAESPEDTAVDLKVLVNDTDPDLDTLSATLATPPSSGAVTLGNNLFTYTPKADWHGDDTFTYRACDPSGLCATATVKVVVTPVNDRPVAVDDAFTVAEDSGATSLDLVANDTDPDRATGDEPAAATVRSVTQPLEGGRVALANGLVTFTPTANFSGIVSFSYEVADAAGATDTGEVTVTVSAVNDPPDALDDALTVAEDAPATAVSVLANDVDIDSVLTVTAVTQPASGGTVSLANNIVRFTPALNFNGTSTFTYTVSDGTASDTANVVVTVTPVNDAPTARTDFVTLDEDSVANTIAVLANDTDPEGLPLSVFSVSTSLNGTVKLENGIVTFTPNPNFSGSTFFTYQIRDSGNLGAGATVLITVTPRRDPPTPADDAFTVAEDAAPTALAVLGNDTDPDGEALTVTAVTQPAQGSVTLDNGTVNFAPATNFNGLTTFNYTVTDPTGLTASASATVTVTPTNDAPEAVDDTGAVGPGRALTLDLAANDRDLDGDALTVTAVTQPENGTTALDGGRVVFTSPADFSGETTFTYTVSDGRLSDTATVTITVLRFGLFDDRYTVRTDRLLEVPAPGLLDNDVLPGPATVTLEAAPASGNLDLATDGGFTFKPDGAGFVTFGYAATVGADRLTAKVDIDVRPAPSGRDDLLALDEDTAAELDVAANDDIDRIDVLTLVDLPTHGEATLSDRLAYVPDPDFAGEDRLTYRLCDGPTCFEAAVDITVRPIADAPRPEDDEALVLGAPVAITVLANDVDPEGDALSLTAVSTPDHGTAVIADGAISYTPDAYEGDLTLTYEVCDATGLCATASVFLTVSRDPTPIATDDLLETTTATAVTFDPLENDRSPIGLTLTVLDVGPAAHGIVTLAPDGRVTYLPSPRFIGTDTFTVTIADSDARRADSLTTVSVVPPPNRAPQAQDDPLTLDEDAPPTRVAVLANDTDPDSDPLTLTVTEVDPLAGTAEVVGDELEFSPAPDFNGATVVRYKVDDGRGGTDSATVQITVRPINDRPDTTDDRFEATEDAAPFTLPVRDNDTDRDTDPLQILTTSTPEGAVLTLENGEILVALAPDYFGNIVFSYTVSDPAGLRDSADVTLVVSPVPDPPVAVDDSARALADGDGVVIDVLGNDTDPDGDVLMIANVTESDHGVVTLDGDRVQFTPEPGFEGETTFGYTAIDPSGLSASATVTVTVSSLLATDDRYTVRADDTLVIAAPGVRGNDLAPDTATVTLLQAEPLAGTLTLAPDGGFTFVPARGFLGDATFEYVISESDKSSRANLVITVVAPPQAGDDEVLTSEDTGILIDVLVNDGAAPTATVTVGEPTHGTAAVANGGVLYVPDPEFAGVDTFVYTACAEDCHDAVVSVLVSPVDDPPRAMDDDAVTPGRVPVDIAVLENDWHPEGQTFGLDSVDAPSHGDVALGDGVVTYTPDLGFVGLDRFRYVVCDARDLCAHAEVTVTVGEGNRRPVARPDLYTLEAGDEADLRVLLNDDDPEGRPLTLTDVSPPRHGEAIRLGAVIAYAADPDFTGIDRFTYTVCDEALACAVTEVVVTLTAEGDGPPPVAIDDARVAVGALTFDPTDNDLGDALTVVEVGDAAHGAITSDVGGLTYTPEPGFVGEDRFAINLEDGLGRGTSSTVVVHVRATPDAAPTAEADALSASGLEDTLLAVLDNDRDPEGALRLHAVTVPASGAIAFTSEGLVYTPAEGFAGTVAITYSVLDAVGQAASAIATVAIGDHDGDGLPDTLEVTLGTDPAVADSDDDGLDDGVELARGTPQVRDAEDTDPLDADSDDDGLADGPEREDGLDPTRADTDADGLPDGLELGVTTTLSRPDPIAATEASRFMADLDPDTTTDPLDADSDDDGLVDGDEDTNVNGRWDGLLGNTGKSGLGETDPTEPDTDGDNLQDGTERGIAAPSVDTDPERFLADLDPTTTTDPLDPDTDDGGASDGDEDTNLNGRVDGGERNPVDDPRDDARRRSSSGGCQQGPLGLLGLLGLPLVIRRRRRGPPPDDLPLRLT